MENSGSPDFRGISCTLPSDPAPVLAQSTIRPVAIDPIHGLINHRHSPNDGLDLLEVEGVESANPLPGVAERRPPHLRQLKGLVADYAERKKRGQASQGDDWLVGMASEAYLRASRVFGHLPAFTKYCLRPQLMHHTAEMVGRYLEQADRRWPVLWFLPEAMNTDDFLGLGLAPWPITHDPGFNKIPTNDPYGDAARLSDHTESNDVSQARGGYWVLWQPRRLPMSNRATLKEQVWLMTQWALDLKCPESEIILGDLPEQAALWVQARQEGMVTNQEFGAVRSATCYRNELLQGDYFRVIDISFGISYAPNGLQMTDFGNQTRITGLGISPLVI